MSAARWHETGVGRPPPENVAVLGWWTPLVFGAVVRRRGNHWFDPGTLFAKECVRPRYWTQLHAPPDPKLPDAKA